MKAWSQLFQRAGARWISTQTASNRSTLGMEMPDTWFKYTSGRWMYNESRRLQERLRVFNAIELQRLAAAAVSRQFKDIFSFKKLGDGDSNRAFVIQFRDGFRLVARIPYPVTQPAQLVVASEAATMVFLRSNGIQVPKVYGYSASADNPAKTEYIFMEFSPGKQLSTVWSDMDERGRHCFVRSLVDLEARLFNLRLPASGSLYFCQDLPTDVKKLAVNSSDTIRPDSFCIGPRTNLELWYGRRSGLCVNRGPYTEPEAVLAAPAEKEKCYLQQYGRPLFPFNRMLRETFHLEKQSPSIHLNNIEKYLQISEALIPRGNKELLLPIMRHPNLRSSNIFVSDDFEIISLISWQNSTVLPLYLHSGIPVDLDNSMDAVSRSLEKPELSDRFSELSESMKLSELEAFHKRQLYHFYVTETATKNPTHFEALIDPFSTARRRIYYLSGAPWEGNNIPLMSSLISVKQQWGQIVARPEISCPINFTEEEERECLRLDKQNQEAEDELQEVNEMLGVGPEGWVSHDNFEAAKAAVSRTKQICLEGAESNLDKVAVRDHWVYDDMDEDEYL